ncbi:MAG TPA: NAD(P)H-binding protein [Candidatus Limnocylindrales bacterium]|nr:NAD(P)H-binding protein [Candidatus Limnocylindrales bacterium]
MKIVVIGDTGLIGSKVVTNLTELGHEAVPASPRSGVNTITGEGLEDALTGASVVVDVSNSPTFEYLRALEFFATSARHLVSAERSASVGHHVVLSVVGTEELSGGGDLTATTAGYFLAKLVEEALVRTSGIPYSIVHATQFFEFLGAIADVSTHGEIVRLPPVAFQPMAAADVARAVARVAAGEPANGLVEVAGPETFELDQAVEQALMARHDPREVVRDASATYYGIRVGERSLVPRHSTWLGETRLEDWLRDAVPVGAA